MSVDTATANRSAERVRRLDPLVADPVVPLDRPPDLRHGGALGWIADEPVDPESLRATWTKLRRYSLAVVWDGEPTDLDALLTSWAAVVQETRPPADSQVFVQWPSRDVEASRVFRAHGLVPELTVAARVHGAAPPPPPVVPRSAGWQIRPARAADLDGVVELWLEQIAYPAGIDTTTLRPSTRRATRASHEAVLGSSPYIWVAHQDDRLIGLLRAGTPAEALLPPPAQATPSNWLSVLAVTAAAREQGVGAGLVRTAHAAFAEADIAATALHYTTLNPLSVPFWARRGYRPLLFAWSTWPASTVR